MDQAAADEFVRRFAKYWQAPTRAGLGELLADDVRLVTPLMPTTEGLDAAQEAFAGMFELIPDLTGQVHRWGPHADGCFIEFTLRGTLNGAPISWRAIDAFDVEPGGRATRRVSYFDPTPLLAAANGATT
jgi:hypothetical protein